MTCEERFGLIYALDTWRGIEGESASGAGSSLDYTKTFRQELENLLRQQKIKLIFDAPCGDMNWMRHVSIPEYCQYVGGDIAVDLIRQHKKNPDLHSKVFMEFNIITDRFPEAGLWLCRDCLFHLSDQDIMKALVNFTRSSIPLAAITCHDNVNHNRDIESGLFRPLDLRLLPFLLPEPALKLWDWVDPFPPRFVGVWARTEIEKSIRA